MKLARHLAILIVIKLMVLTALWFAFFRGQYVKPNADEVMQHLSGSPAVGVVSNVE